MSFSLRKLASDSFTALIWCYSYHVILGRVLCHNAYSVVNHFYVSFSCFITLADEESVYLFLCYLLLVIITMVSVRKGFLIKLIVIIIMSLL